MQNINSIERLRKIDRQLRTFSLVSHMPDYQFAIPELSESINQEKSQKLNLYKNECGCSMGSLFVGLSIIILISYFIIDQQAIFPKNFKHYIFIVSFIIGGAIIGKLVGLVWARLRMVQTVKNTIGLIKKQEY